MRFISSGESNFYLITGMIRLMSVMSLQSLFHVYAVAIPASIKILTVSLSLNAIATNLLRER